MNKEQIRIAVAEELGWVFERTGQSIERDYHIGCITWTVTSPEGKLFEYRKGYNEIEYLTKESACNDRVPNYPESLDDCQEMVNSLNEEEQHAFCVILSGMLWLPEDTRGWLDWRDTLALLKAKPLQHCIAFLKVKNNTDYLK